MKALSFLACSSDSFCVVARSDGRADVFIGACPLTVRLISIRFQGSFVTIFDQVASLLYYFFLP